MVLKASGTFGAKKAERVFKVMWHWRCEVHLFPGAGMLKRERMRMKHYARWIVVSQLRQAACLTLAVGVVPGNRMAEMLEMNPDLVGAARM